MKQMFLSPVNAAGIDNGSGWNGGRTLSLVADDFEMLCSEQRLALRNMSSKSQNGKVYLYHSSKGNAQLFYY